MLVPVGYAFLSTFQVELSDADVNLQHCHKRQIQCMTKYAVEPGPSEQLTPISSTSTFEPCAAALVATNDDDQTLQEFFDTDQGQSQKVSTFFEQIMVPNLDIMGQRLGHPSPNFTAWEPDLDWIGQVDIFSNDFAPTVDQTLALQEGLQEAHVTTASVDEDSAQSSENNASARRRHAVFQRSPW